MTPRFLQLHALTSYGPANLNRDDLGSPKTVMLGGRKRLRISSQALKRAWRTSDLFEASLKGALGTRSKRFFLDYFESKGAASGIKATDFAKWIAPFATRFGDFDKKGESGEGAELKKELRALQLSTLVFLSDRERSALHAVLDKLVEERREARADEVETFAKLTGAADISMFGRMLASDPHHNVEAAAQIAHAITVHAAEPEDDYFSAVDDLNTVDSGSGHLGELGYGAGVFYLYACIDRKLLLENLGHDQDLAGRAIRALVECMATVAPTGKQKSFASHAAASYLLAELGDAQPRQLTAAFVQPVTDDDVIAAATRRLTGLVRGFDEVYGWNGQRFGVDALHPTRLADLSSVEAGALAGDSGLAKLCSFAAASGR
jgi:CRISPR system Cascade subunit CasC